MNVMSSLTVRQMRLNKRRTLITILGVIISVAMITAVSTFTGSFQDLFYRSEIATDGNWHVRIDKADPALRDRIALNEGVASAYFLRFEGFTIPSQIASGFQRLALLSLEEAAFEPLQVKLTQGRLPQNSHEIALSNSYFDNAPAPIAIGDTLTLQNGVLTVTAEGETFDLPYDTYSASEAVFTPGEPQDYIIVGFADMRPLIASWDTIPVITLLDPATLVPDDDTRLFVTESNPTRAIYDRYNPIFEETQLSGGFHSSLLIYKGVAYDDGLTSTMLVMSAILVAIIMIGSISLIYNSFAISLSERSSQFGMLSSIGATGRQNRGSVLTEAGVISLISIPLGIIGGLLGIAITFRIVSPMMVESFGLDAPLRLKVLPLALVAAALLSLITIFLSAWLPARRASRITPMQAIRRSEDIKLRGKDVKTSPLFRRLFGVEGEIALKNLKRYRKRYRVTIVSLVTSLVLLLAAISFTYYLKSSFLITQDELSYNVFVRVLPQKSDASPLPALRAVAALDSKNAQLYLTQNARGSVPKEFLTPETLALDPYSQDGLYEASYELYGMEDDALRAFCAQNGIDSTPFFDETKPAAIYLNRQVVQVGANFTELNPFNLKTGDTLAVTIDETESSLSISGVCSEPPTFVSNRSYSPAECLLILRADTLMKLTPDNTPYGFTAFFSKDPNALCTQVDELIGDSLFVDMNVNYQNINEEMREANQMLTIVNIFVFGFITLIALIGCANILNTVTTGLMLRRRELAMLRSVGMTPRSFARMIRFESLLYGLKALLYGLPLGFAVMYGMHSLLGRNFDTPFTIPWLGVLIGSLLILGIVGLSMAYSSARLKRDHIIEALRADNI